MNCHLVNQMFDMSITSICIISIDFRFYFFLFWNEYVLLSFKKCFSSSCNFKNKLEILSKYLDEKYMFIKPVRKPAFFVGFFLLFLIISNFSIFIQLRIWIRVHIIPMCHSVCVVVFFLLIYSIPIDNNAIT